MKTYKEFISESIRDKMTGVSKEDILNKLDTMSLARQIETVMKYNLGVENIPSKEELIDEFFYVDEHPLTLRIGDEDVEKIYDINNKIVKNIHDEIFHTFYRMSYYKIQRQFLDLFERDYVVDMIKFWCDEENIDEEKVKKLILSNNNNVDLAEGYHKLVNETEYVDINGIISDLIGYYDKEKFKIIAKKIITFKLGLPEGYLD